MKLLCVNQEFCGLSFPIGKIDPTYFRNNTCPECFGPAAVVESNYIPLNEEEIIELAAKLSNHIKKVT